MHERTSRYELGLVGGAERLNAQVVVAVRDWTEHGLRHRPCTVVITWADQSVESTADSVYHAFRAAREQLERLGLTPDCYGSCPDVQTSGMLCDMGDGTMAYRMGGVAGGERPPTVNIFDSEPGLKLGTVAEQKAYLVAGREPELAPDGRGLFVRWPASWRGLVQSIVAGVRSAFGSRAKDPTSVAEAPGPGYHRLPLTLQSPTPRVPVDKTTWRPCARCGRHTPVSEDRIQDAAGHLAKSGTATYVCPFCGHCSVGTPETWNDNRLHQEVCHHCGTRLSEAYQCPGCGFPRGWTEISCPYCGSRQPVDAPHLVIHCDMFRLQCVKCESEFESYCIC